MQNFESQIKNTRPVEGDTYRTWPVSFKPTASVQQVVIENKDKRAAGSKMDFDSRYRLLLFLKKTI